MDQFLFCAACKREYRIPETYSASVGMTCPADHQLLVLMTRKQKATLEVKPAKVETAPPPDEKPALPASAPASAPVAPSVAPPGAPEPEKS